jgi:hypothetical protein
MHGYSNRTRFDLDPTNDGSEVGRPDIVKIQKNTLTVESFLHHILQRSTLSQTDSLHLFGASLIVHHQKKKHLPSGIFHSGPRFHKQQDQPEGLKLQKEI